MARYKISKRNINEFFGLFKSKKPKDRAAVDKMLALHPGLRAIDKEIEKLNKRAQTQIDNDPWVQKFLKKNNIETK
jgi:hypothetical protein|tara:strand:- start:789 stop:1016 length:228 start_codon:yes stop_codon:yes gene_type:complete